MEAAYKGHVITITSTQAGADHWDLSIAVGWTHYGLRKTEKFTIPQNFDSYDQAVVEGLVWAQRWIDDGKPPRA
jgi:hypothetical protein